MLDRIDIHVEMTAVAYEDLASKQAGESSAAIRERVSKARCPCPPVDTPFAAFSVSALKTTA